MTGHYGFVDYSIAHWAEHLSEVIKSNDAKDLKSLHVDIEHF